MKLRNNRFNYAKDYKESIGYEQLRRCIFRFLKEFGYYSAYVRDIKPHLKIYDLDYSFAVEKKISYKDFVRRSFMALSRNIFPQGELWDDIYPLWVEWAFEEDKIYSRTRLL